MSQYKDDFEQILDDLKVELNQVKEQLAQDTADIGQSGKQLRALGTSLEESFSEGTRALTALYKIVMAANQVESLELLLDEALLRAMDALNSNTGIVVVFEDGWQDTDPFRARVIVERSRGPDMPHKQGSWLKESALLAQLVELSEPLLIPDISQDARIPLKMHVLDGQLLLAPMRIEDHTQGVVVLMRPTGSASNHGEMAVLSSVTNQIGAAVHQLELRKQAQQGKLLAERERLSRDLHDTITQSLYGLAALAEAGDAQLESGDLQTARHTFKRIGQTTRQALREMRLFIHELHPGILEQNGLVAALQLRLAAVEGRADTQVRLVAEEPLELPKDLESALYRIALEALNNSMRHADAGKVTVLLRREHNEVLLEVADDGCGFDPEQHANGGMGLDNMRLYASEIGARLQVNSALAQGTTIRVAVPGERIS